MNTRKVKEIIKFDIEKSIQNKWFVILNVVMFIGILIATNWSNISKYLEDNNIDFLSKSDITIQVVDNENLIYDEFAEKYKDYDNLKIEKVKQNVYTKENIPDDDVILFEIQTNYENIVKSTIVSKEGIDDDIYQMIYDEIVMARSRIFADDIGITLADLEILNEEPDIERQLLGVDAENSDTKEMIKMFSIIIVYMVLIFVLSRIASEIAQEKVSKSIEYVLTSVSAKEYLLAKVVGTTLTVLIQVLYTFVYYMIGNMISSLFVTATTDGSVNIIGNIDTSILSYVLAMAGYLIFTVFLTTLIQAALSAKTTSIAEAGNTTMLLMAVIIALYIISMGAISPYITVTPFMYIISCLPIVSTFFVPSMMIIGQATTYQIIISFVLLILFVPLIFDLCAKHFKNGILDYTSTKKKGLFRKKEKKELDLKQKQEYELRLAKAKKFAFTIGMAMIILVFLETLTTFIAGLALPSLLANKVSEGTFLVIENSICIIIALSLTAAFIKFYSEDIKQEEKKSSGKEKFEIVFIGIALIAGLQLFLGWLYPKIGLDYSVFESFNILPGNSILGKITYVLGMAAVPAIFEELLFRKAILNSSKRYGNVFAIIFSSLLFGIYHFNLNQGIFAFLVGIIFAVIAVKTNSIKLTVLLHFLNNGYACIESIITDSVIIGIINNVILALVVFGIIILIKNLPKLKNIEKENLKINKDCMFLLKNYTFIVAMVLLVIMFVVTEKMLV